MHFFDVLPILHRFTRFIFDPEINNCFLLARGVMSPQFVVVGEVLLKYLQSALKDQFTEVGR